MLAQLTIDLGAICANIAALRTLVAPAKIAAVIKGEAYGHGLIAVGRAIETHVDRLCVYELPEAVALREAGIMARIHVLGPIAPGDLDLAHATNAEITLWNHGTYARQVASIARRRHAPFAVHAKIDTGVTRLGMSVTEASGVLARYVATPEYHVAGVFSHLAAAEELDSTFTTEQLTKFSNATAALDPTVERHIAASAAAMLWPETRLGAIRPGIAIYGIWPSDETAAIMHGRAFTLTPALQWTTEIIAMHDVPAHTSVGYGCAYYTKRPSRIGVLPIGYAEGLPRSASDRAFVIVHGKRVPIIGRVCMNMAFVDLTTVPEAIPGSAATLIGRDGDARIDANEFAAWCGTIGYELVTRLPSHVPRRYINER